MHCSIISIFLALLSLGWCLPLPNWSAMQEQNYLHCTATLMSQLTLIQTATDSMGKVWLFGGSGSLDVAEEWLFGTQLTIIPYGWPLDLILMVVLSCLLPSGSIQSNPKCGCGSRDLIPRKPTTRKS
jgi:hypothetical protein